MLLCRRVCGGAGLTLAAPRAARLGTCLGHAHPPRVQVYVNLVVPGLSAGTRAINSTYAAPAANASCLSVCDVDSCTSTLPGGALGLVASKCNTRCGARQAATGRCGHCPAGH